MNGWPASVLNTISLDRELSIVDDGAFHHFITDLSGNNGGNGACEGELIKKICSKFSGFTPFR
jgi:hypothetical protein